MLRLLFLVLFLLSCSQPSEAPVTSPPPAPQVASETVEEDNTEALLNEKEMILLGTAETFFASAGDQRDRAANIRLAAAQLDQLEVGPSMYFSFNEAVGPRSAERGFRMAPTILLGELVKDLGGGTCQVSSTLFQAVVDAQQQLLERRPHSRVPKYTGPGRDAMVSYPPECQNGQEDPAVCVDLKFENISEAPILIEARVLQVSKVKSRLRIDILGHADERGVTRTTWKQFSTTEFEKKTRKLEGKPNGFKARKQKGENGITGVLLVSQEAPSGEVSPVRIRSTYKPVDEIWEVGPDWDEATNPWE